MTRVLRSSTRAAVFSALALASISCASSPAMHAAESGDYASLRREIAAKEQTGSLTNGDAADLARAVASREVLGAKPDSALARLRDVRACSIDLDDVFKDRMKTHDAAGAEAALARLEMGRIDESDARAWLTDPDDRWRGVATLTLAREDDAAARRRAFLDPSPHVRVAALRAAERAQDPADHDALFEAARLDPDPLARSEAVRALALLAGRRGPEAESSTLASRIGIELRDLWTSGDDATREDVAIAWSISPLYEDGGREALLSLFGDGHGPGVVEAAGAALRTHPKKPSPHDADLRAAAAGVLSRAIEEGSRRDRLHAIAIAPLEGPPLQSVEKAAHGDDPEVVVAALARTLAVEKDHASAVKDLEAFAAQKDDRGLGARARSALAEAGDVRIQSWIEQDLAAKDPRARVGAASALASLGRSARGAPLLADEDAEVRTRAACVLLAAQHAH